jgi:hypothetical protein
VWEFVAVPDSKIARGASALATHVEPAFLLRHSERTFQFGAQLLAATQRSFDSELLYVASMLHDIALGTEMDDGVTPFQFKGGGVAGKYVIDAQLSDEVATLMFDAIALHMELSTADDPRPEVAGVHLGAAADVIGLRLDQIEPELLEVIVHTSPRLGMKRAFADVIAAEARLKPYSQAAALIMNFGFLDLIGAAPFEE